MELSSSHKPADRSPEAQTTEYSNAQKLVSSCFNGAKLLAETQQLLREYQNQFGVDERENLRSVLLDEVRLNSRFLHSIRNAMLEEASRCQKTGYSELVEGYIRASSAMYDVSDVLDQLRHDLASNRIDSQIQESSAAIERSALEMKKAAGQLEASAEQQQYFNHSEESGAKLAMIAGAVALGALVGFKASSALRRQFGR